MKVLWAGYGNSGTGKTHLAVALGIDACGQGKRVRFYQVTELVTQLMEAREQRELTRLKKQIAKLELLILNEMGYVPASKLGSELLFDVISTTYERFSLIVTTNLPFENWTEVLGSLSQRTADGSHTRLAHPSLPYPGNDRRKLPVTGCQTAAHKKLKQATVTDEITKDHAFVPA